MQSSYFKTNEDILFKNCVCSLQILKNKITPKLLVLVIGKPNILFSTNEQNPSLQ